MYKRQHFHSSLYKRIHNLDTAASRSFEERAGFSNDEDITAHDDIGIRCESDLMDIPGSSIGWLADKVGPSHVGKGEVREIADSVRALGKLKAQVVR